MCERSGSVKDAFMRGRTEQAFGWRAADARTGEEH